MNINSSKNLATVYKELMRARPDPSSLSEGAGLQTILTLPVAMLSMRSLDSATVLYSNSYYTVVASIFLVSAASCKAICEVTSVRTSDYSQPFG